MNFLPCATDLKVSLLDFTMGVAGAMDAISPLLVNHHKQVAYIALCIAEEMSFTAEQKYNIFLAAMLHDVGAISLKDRLDALTFELKDTRRHAEAGYYLLKNYLLFEPIANLIRWHHVMWENGKGQEAFGHTVDIASHIIHFADRASVSINVNLPVAGQIKDVKEALTNPKNTMFAPTVLDAFATVSEKKDFWADVVDKDLGRILIAKNFLADRKIGCQELQQLAKVFCHITDFRSRFTAIHSHGVAFCAKTLARLMGMDDSALYVAEIAGYLHDIGKLGVPTELLEKPGKLTADELDAVRWHAYYTHRILSNISGFDAVNQWASLHHEKPDGSGYPFRYQGAQLPIGARIMAVADIFTALTEDRPYRKGMLGHEALKTMDDMARQNGLDQDVLSVLKKNEELVNDERSAAQKTAAEAYRDYDFHVLRQPDQQSMLPGDRSGGKNKEMYFTIGSRLRTENCKKFVAGAN